MRFSFLAAGLLLGLDSLLVSIPLGAQRMSAAQRRRLVLAFALCDGVASYLGWVAGAASWWAGLGWSEWLGPAVVASYGIYVLFLAWQGRRLEATRSAGWLALSLPLCLSLDNLLAGVGGGASFGSAGSAPLVCGLVSGCLSLLGLHVGQTLAARFRGRAECFAGIALLAVALLF